MSPTESAALTILAKHAPLSVFSTQVIRESKGKLGLGSATATLQALEYKGLVDSGKVAEGGMERRAYSITDKGRKALDKFNAKDTT